MVMSLVREKEVMEKLHHPFIMKYYKSFKDDRNIYFIQEHIPGDMLFEVVNFIEDEQEEKISSGQVRFYIAQIVLVLKYIHT